jgi:hypothetical protein
MWERVRFNRALGIKIKLKMLSESVGDSTEFVKVLTIN